MADFRKSVYVLALFALLVGTAVTASAQGPAFQCQANAGVPPIVRSEGVTEKTGDMILNCTGGTATAAGQPIPQVNIQIFLNTNVTSKIVNGGTLTEAFLFLDDPGPQNAANPVQSPCLSAPFPCANFGNGQGAPTPATPDYYVGQANGNNVNVFQGEITPGRTDSILWRGVPIDPPGTNGTRVIRITNVRAHAAGLGTGISPVPITMLVTATGTFSVPINNPSQTVAVIQKTLDVAVSNAPTSLQQCFSQTNRLVGTLTYNELVPSAFKKFNAGSGSGLAGSAGPTPTTAVSQNNFLPSLNTETGFYNPLFPSTNGLNIAGLPNFGTRFRATFANVPNGVSLLVTAVVVDAATNTERIIAVTSDSGGYAAATTTTCPDAAGCVAVSLTSGTGTVYWEVVDSNASTFANFPINVYATYTANPGANSPAIGPAATASGSYAPITTVFTAVASPIPRFVDTGTTTTTFSVVACKTALLFPYVTYAAGFDTGVAISATSLDSPVFATSPQGGNCSLYWYAGGALVNTTALAVAAGATNATLASAAVSAGTSGYMIASCLFQYAHGFAFVSDVGASRLAMGYLALVIPDLATRGAVPFSCAGGLTGTDPAGTVTLGCPSTGEMLAP